VSRASCRWQLVGKEAGDSCGAGLDWAEAVLMAPCREDPEIGSWAALVEAEIEAVRKADVARLQGRRNFVAST
jgi:hypothetical protein